LLREHEAVLVHDTPGTGRHFFSDDSVWFLGRPGWLSSTESSPHDAEFRQNDQVIARFHFQESLRPDAIAALDALRKDHRLVILSGDRVEKVTTAARLLKVLPQDAHASLSPTEKEQIVRRLDDQDTLYLGDGANDSLAFDAAWCTGTPAIDRGLLEQKADFYFLGHGLRFLPKLLALAKRRRKVVHFAFAFALLYNMAAIAAALTGHMNPLVAAIIMPLSSAISLSIVASGLREIAYSTRTIALSGNTTYGLQESTIPHPGGHEPRHETFRTEPL
jgi:Cu2+-exporting ATPase